MYDAVLQLLTIDPAFTLQEFLELWVSSQAEAKLKQQLWWMTSQSRKNVF